jgi:hypothetical protein
LPGQPGSASQLRRYGIAGLAAHLAGFALGFVSIGLVFAGVIDIGSGIAVETPFADMLYGLGLVIVVAAAARAGVPMKYLLVAGAVIGVGVFFKSAPHEIHVASGIGFGLVHNGHIVTGTEMITVSVVAVAVILFLFLRRSQPGSSGNKVT